MEGGFPRNSGLDTLIMLLLHIGFTLSQKQVHVIQRTIYMYDMS